MESHKMDNLFREHASKYEVKPSAAAWDQISGQLTKKNSYAVYWKVAAAILLVTGLGYTMMQVDMQSYREGMAIEATHPVQSELAFEWEITEKVDIESGNNSVAVVKIADQEKDPVDRARGNTIEDKVGMGNRVELLAFESFEVESIRSIDVELIDPATDFSLSSGIETKSGSGGSKVKITYIASNNDTSEKGTIKRIFEYAKTNTPIDMLSDIRQAKNEFISNKISLD